MLLLLKVPWLHARSTVPTSASAVRCGPDKGAFCVLQGQGCLRSQTMVCGSLREVAGVGVGGRRGRTVALTLTLCHPFLGLPGFIRT